MFGVWPGACWFFFVVKEVERLDNPRPEKVAVVDEVRARLDAASAAILTEYRGLSVKDLAALRRALTAAGGTYKVYKNTLVRFAVRDLGLGELESMLTGPTAITFVEGDAVEVAKTLRDFARTHPLLVVKGGVLGQSVLSPADATALADLPSRDLLLARLAGALAAPMVQFAGLLQALPRNFAYGLKALIDQGGVPGAPASPAAEPAAEASDVPGPEAETATPTEEPVAESEAAAEPEAEPAPAVAPGAAAEPESAAEAPAEAAAPEGQAQDGAPEGPADETADTARETAGTADMDEAADSPDTGPTDASATTTETAEE